MAEEQQPKTVKVDDVMAPEKKAAPKSSAKSSSKKSKHRHTHIHHHDDGTHTVRHIDDKGKETSYTKPDLDGVHDGLEEHVGDPNHDEAAEPSPASETMQAEGGPQQPIAQAQPAQQQAAPMGA